MPIRKQSLCLLMFPAKAKVKDGRGNEKVFELNRQHTGIYLPEMVWKDIYDFSVDSVLLCLASEHYDAKEYICSYKQFAALTTERENE